MDRISMKKFKFHTTTDVFMQCKIRACAAQPCGTCKDSRRGLSFAADLSPVEGEMFAPPTKIRVSAFDKNALVFAATPLDAAPQVPAALPASAMGTSQPAIEIASDLTLPLSIIWATENRAAVEASLRSTLGLTQAETLRIVSITAARRQLQSSTTGEQSAKIDFIVGVSSPARAELATSSLGALSAGAAVVVRAFTQQLDQSLAALGRPVVSLRPETVKFAGPRQQAVSAPVSSAAIGSNSPNQQTPTVSNFGQQQALASDAPPVLPAARNESSSSTNLVIVLLLAVIAAGALYYLIGRGHKGQSGPDPAQGEGGGDAYAAKIAADGLVDEN
jgi:hypothetical protein